MSRFYCSWYCPARERGQWLDSFVVESRWFDLPLCRDGTRITVVEAVIEAVDGHVAKDLIVQRHGLVSWREFREVNSTWRLTNLGKS